MTTNAKREVTCLIADDSEDDRFFLRQIFRRYPRFKFIGEARDGEEAVAYLSGKPPYDNRQQHPLPDVLFLDLKMPRVGGFEVLQWLRRQLLPQMTVAVLTNSCLAQDRTASLELGAHGFWVKSPDCQKQTQMIQEIEAIIDARPASGNKT